METEPNKEVEQGQEVEKPTVETNVEVDWQKEAEKYKTLAKTWETKSKSNFEKARNFDEVSTKLSTLENSLNTIQEENLLLKKKEVISRFSLPETILNRIQGNNQEELENDAKEWVEILGVQASEGQPKPKAKPVPTQGAEAENQPGAKVKTKEDFVAFLNARKK